MPARTTTTARQERLGAELRKLRERAGLTARDAARGLAIDHTKISHMEAGRVGVSAERLRSLASFYACPDTAFVDALAVMAEERHRGWWEEYRDALAAAFFDLAELEHHASSIRTSEIFHIPGLLQTECHARALISYAEPAINGADLEARVAFRMRRRAVLEGEEAVTYEAVVHEAALRMRVADRDVSRAQLNFLLQASERPNVTLRAIPFDVDGFGGAGFSMVIVGGPVPQLDTVLLDAAFGGVFLDAEAQVAKYRSLFQTVRESSLGTAESRDLIRRIAQDM
ncbi:helix-turn-helix domain-containing protein [Streptomyces zagrosensis]|uniref:Transcriptional regulator with XRE-family HTH domain n=1 Tax=Streptomyces zagrosensis TaxID=1042984 RepID=A0A7W9Q596_9ACTN|nr:helix-turn-helix transcriptional regulator [Streptomyces zagrosensis]MBB5933863.1 transcriptional regulator with XRE-family HTH domain [Streptomyces zagrosensis]